LYDGRWQLMDVTADPRAWVTAYLEAVPSRLRSFPAQAFDFVRGVLADGIAAGESIPQLRDRVGAALQIDAPSRVMIDRLARLDAQIADPDLTGAQRDGARAPVPRPQAPLTPPRCSRWWPSRRWTAASFACSGWPRGTHRPASRQKNAPARRITTRIVRPCVWVRLSRWGVRSWPTRVTRAGPHKRWSTAGAPSWRSREGAGGARPRQVGKRPGPTQDHTATTQKG
jgi:hypothetical protein